MEQFTVQDIFNSHPNQKIRYSKKLRERFGVMLKDLYFNKYGEHPARKKEICGITGEEQNVYCYQGSDEVTAFAAKCFNAFLRRLAKQVRKHQKMKQRPRKLGERPNKTPRIVTRQQG